MCVCVGGGGGSILCNECQIKHLNSFSTDLYWLLPWINVWNQELFSVSKSLWLLKKHKANIVCYQFSFIHHQRASDMHLTNIKTAINESKKWEVIWTSGNINLSNDSCWTYERLNSFWFYFKANKSITLKKNSLDTTLTVYDCTITTWATVSVTTLPFS